MAPRRWLRRGADRRPGFGLGNLDAVLGAMGMTTAAGALVGYSSARQPSVGRRLLVGIAVWAGLFLFAVSLDLDPATSVVSAAGGTALGLFVMRRRSARFRA